MRESERQRDEATRYAQSVLREQKSLKDRLTKLDTGYVSEMESRITSSLDAAKSKLREARDTGSIEAEIEAQKEIAKLGYEEARLADMKLNQEAEKRRVNQLNNNQIFNKHNQLTRQNQMRKQLNGQLKMHGLGKIIP